MVKASIIIPTLNEEKYLELTVQSIRNQTFKDYEIIVSDGNSDDKTVIIAKKLVDKLVVSKNRGISVQRNKAAAIAKGEILIFTDADIIHPNNWLEEIINKFEENPELTGLSGNAFLLTSKKSVMITSTLIFHYARRVAQLFRKPFATGANMACKKEFFKRVGGFNEEMETREDTELMIRIAKQGKVKFCPEIVVWASDRRLKLGKKKAIINYLDNLKFLVTKKGVKYEEAR